ncbi:MAG TPA: hypothetical protein DCE56_23540 [Cyanobacteria bacterium UBA8553]|nr:hypothetical protein [Cyanobacteria bacterium UBA8553]HAJ62053.1 hypothetical protein [Cyanobacteria bacterium UBA8543]
MTNGEQDKRQIRDTWAISNTKAIESVPTHGEQVDQNLDEVSQRASQDEEKHLFGKSLRRARIPLSEMEPELQKAIAQIKPNERRKVAQEFLKQLKERKISDRALEQQLNLSTHHANGMTADDVTKLAAYTYYNHSDIFQDVLAQQPVIVKFLSNPLLGAILGAIAIKWLGNRQK